MVIQFVEVEKRLKKVLTFGDGCGIITKLSHESEENKRKTAVDRDRKESNDTETELLDFSF